MNETTPVSALHGLHEGRRKALYAGFLTRLQQDRSLQLQEAPPAHHQPWTDVCKRIFDAVFDRHDLFEKGDQAIYVTRRAAILGDLQTLIPDNDAELELIRIANHALQEVTAIHAQPGQRGKLHRAQRQDAKGRWRNPDGTWAPHYDRVHLDATLQDLLTNARGTADQSNALKHKYSGLAKEVRSYLDRHFWPQNSALAKVRGVTGHMTPFTREQLTRAAMLMLLQDHPDLPVPVIPQKEPSFAKRRTYMGAHNITEPAIAVGLYEYIQAQGIETMMRLLHDEPAETPPGREARMVFLTRTYAERMEPIEQQVRFVMHGWLANPQNKANADYFSGFDNGLMRIGQCLQQSLAGYISQRGASHGV